MHTRPVGGMWMFAGRSDSRTWSGLRNPRAVFTARICTPPITDAPATSLLKMWESRSRTTSQPGCVWPSTERRLPCVPDATKSPASLPTRSAARASRRLTVGSSSHTSSPTSARAMASRISGVGSVSVSERRSTMSCMTISGPSALPLSREPLGGAPTEIGVGELDGKTVQQLLGRVGFALGIVHLGQQPERLGIDERAHIVLEDQLETLAGPARIALVDVVGGHPHLFLCEAPAADVDLGQAVGGVATLWILLHHCLERLQRLLGQRMILFDRLDLVVVAHGQPILHQIGDLMARVEGQERLEFLDGLVELGIAVEGFAEQEARPRRVGGIGMAFDDLREGLPCVLVPLVVQKRFTLRIELLGGQNGSGLRLQPTAPSGGHEREHESDSSESGRHRNCLYIPQLPGKIPACHSLEWCACARPFLGRASPTSPGRWRTPWPLPACRSSAVTPSRSVRAAGASPTSTSSSAPPCGPSRTSAPARSSSQPWAATGVARPRASSRSSSTTASPKPRWDVPYGRPWTSCGSARRSASPCGSTRTHRRRTGSASSIVSSPTPTSRARSSPVSSR